MVIYEEHGAGMVRAYSNRGMLIHGGDPEDNYQEAIDPASAGRTYTETEIPIDADEPASVEEKAQAWDIITGKGKGECNETQEVQA